MRECEACGKAMTPMDDANSMVCGGIPACYDCSRKTWPELRDMADRLKERRLRRKIAGELREMAIGDDRANEVLNMGADAIEMCPGDVIPQPTKETK